MELQRGNNRAGETPASQSPAGEPDQQRNELALSQEEIEQGTRTGLFDDSKLVDGQHPLDPDRPNYRPTGIPDQV